MPVGVQASCLFRKQSEITKYWVESMVVSAHGSERCQRSLQGAVRLNKAGVERVQQMEAAVGGAHCHFWGHTCYHCQFSLLVPQLWRRAIMTEREAYWAERSKSCSKGTGLYSSNSILEGPSLSTSSKVGNTSPVILSHFLVLLLTMARLTMHGL